MAAGKFPKILQIHSYFNETIYVLDFNSYIETNNARIHTEHGNQSKNENNADFYVMVLVETIYVKVNFWKMRKPFHKTQSNF